MSKYFVYCEYDSHYPHHAYFINLNSIDSTVQQKITELIELVSSQQFPIIEHCIKTCGNITFGIVDTKTPGYYINDVLDNSTKTIDLLAYWYAIEHSDCLLSDDHLVYYINDENRTLSPKNLYQKLMSMTEFENKKIIVDQCVMMCDCSPDFEMPIVLRFYINNDKLNRKDVEEMLGGDPRIIRVNAGSNDGIDFVKYGYVWLKDRLYENELANKTFVIGDNKVLFDRG